jgi:hypothetical protein
MPLFKRKSSPKPESTAPAIDTSSLVVPGLDAHAAASGWTALGKQPFRDMFDDFVTSESLALVHDAPNPLGAQNSRTVNLTTYHSAFGGHVDGKTFAVANASTTGVKGSLVSVAQHWIPVVKLLDISPHGSITKPWGFKTGDDAFDHQFKVSSHDDEFAHTLLMPGVRALLMQRNDWGFMIGFYTVLCVCAEPFGSVDDVTSRLAFLQSLRSALPTELVKEGTSALPKLPDGTVLDMTHTENLRDALLSMTPEQQSALLDQFPHITPERKAQIMAQAAQHKAGGA